MNAPTGSLGTSDVVIQAPTLMKRALSGILYDVIKYPDKLIRAMLIYLEGPGGILAMLRMQAQLDPPKTDPGAAKNAHEELKVQLISKIYQKMHFLLI